MRNMKRGEGLRVPVQADRMREPAEVSNAPERGRLPELQRQRVCLCPDTANNQDAARQVAGSQGSA